MSTNNLKATTKPITKNNKKKKNNNNNNSVQRLQQKRHKPKNPQARKKLL
jgi:hypothetical protein